MPISNDISLAQISGTNQPGQLSDESQLRVNDSGNIYSNSCKSTGFLSSVASRIGFAFVARFFLPTTRNDFRAANKRLAELIKASYGDKAEESFKTSFSSHLYWGKPLTVGSVKRFLADCNAPESNTKNMAAFYGPKMASNAKRLFEKGIIKTASIEGVSQQYKRQDDESAGPRQTQTVLTTEMKSTAEMKMMILHDMNYHERLMPLACAQFFGEEDRGKLLEQGLYKPSTQRKYLEQGLEEIGKGIAKYEELEAELTPMEGLSDETRSALRTATNQLSEEIGRYKNQFTALEEQLKDPSLAQAHRSAINATLNLLTSQLEVAEARYAALLPYAKTDEELSGSGVPLNISDLKEMIKTQKAALIEKQTSFQEYKTWPPYQLAAVAKADALIISKRRTLFSCQTELKQTSKTLDDLQKKLQEELKELDKSSLTPGYVDLRSLIKKKKELVEIQEKIGPLQQKKSNLLREEEGLRGALNAIHTVLQGLTKKAKHEQWDQPSCQAILNFVNKKDPESIQFDRIHVKVNGKILPLKGSQSEKNFQIFKVALLELTSPKKPPLEISDDQIKEMITLCSCEKTAEGFPAGSAGSGDNLPAFGVKEPLVPGEIDCYEIVIPDDEPSSIDFQLRSGRALLPNIQYQGGSEDKEQEQLILLRHEDGGAPPDDFQQFERSCSFTYRYTPKTSGEGEALNMEHGNLGLIKSQQAFWPISSQEIHRLTALPLPDHIQQQFATTLNDTKTHALSETAIKLHEWDSGKDKVVEQDEKLPAISEQFYLDIDCGRYSLLSKEGELRPLYDPNTNNDNDIMHEEGRQKAINTFANFVGDKDQALAISKIANQQLAFVPLLSLMNTADGPLQLNNHGGGVPEGGIKVFHTFLKSPEGNIVIRVNTQQKPQFFLPAGKTDQIELDSQKSFVNFYYDLTCHFDDQGNLSVTPGPINYNCHLEKGDTGLG